MAVGEFGHGLGKPGLRPDVAPGQVAEDPRLWRLKLLEGTGSCEPLGPLQVADDLVAGRLV